MAPMQDKKRRFGGYGYAVGHLTRKHKRDCQRCGSSFTTDRIAPYCWPCFQAKREERLRRLA